ncbi:MULTISPECIES: hypothetical protein [Streptomyces]|uniref:hypothetical protein n=1 Tax=Streptomyces TaxID=1883 RepID=UPI00167BA532|nr:MULTISPECIES: hypothetical protein [Streptomyces]MBK3526490.1 hypothetical protein [Streptomyces sp. MBT70]GGS04221.1 hypothetical protein GCM10010236_68480 [Streptomyces eurythermus]
MALTVSSRSVRLAVLAGAGVLAATAVYAVTDHADASEGQAPPVAAATAGHHTTAPATTPTGPTAPAATPSATQAPPAVAGKAAPVTTPSTRAPGTAGDKALAATRVTARQLPDRTAQKWKELAPPSTRRPGPEFQLNECVTVRGATGWQQQGFISAHKTPAVQDSLGFPDTASAQAAYREVLAGMKGCEATSRALQKRYGLAADARVRQTATAPDAAAWSRTWTAVQGLSAPGAQANHIYAVRRGSVLVLLHFDEWDSAAPRSYDPKGDADVLAGLTR